MEDSFCDVERGKFDPVDCAMQTGGGRVCPTTIPKLSRLR